MPDILDEFDSLPKEDQNSYDNKPKQESNQDRPKQQYSKKKKDDLWDNPDIEGKPIDKDKLDKYTRAVYIASIGDIDESVIFKIDKIARELYSKGFRLRLDGEKDDRLAKIARGVFQGKEEVYLPWKGFNKEEAENAKLTKPTTCGYHHAAYYHKGFKKIPSAVRAIVARDTGIITGEDCMTPIKLMVIYTADGASNTQEVDYKTTGRLSYYIRLASELNIPVFNLSKSGEDEKVLRYLESLN